MKDNQGNLKKSLKTRHLTMIAIGGSIGAGLFVGSGATISQAGPGGALLSYAIIGIMVYFLMTSLGELAAFYPSTGSFATYGARYVDEGFGFALGWNYWYNWAITIAVDLVAAQLVMAYWIDITDYGLPSWFWSALFLIILFVINSLSVRNFGETEYWFSLIKVLTVLVFIIAGLAMIVGLMLNKQETSIWHNWQIGDAPFVGGFASMIGVAMIVGFSFQGTELVGIAAGESKDPAKSVPKATRSIFWRILLFYILSIFVISILIPYTDPRLLNDDVAGVSVSPFTIVFENFGVLFAASLVNAVILTSVLSAGNSGMYSSTRMLYSLARDKKAPKLFMKVNKRGVPQNALYATTLIACLCFLTSMFGEQKIYLWLLNLSGMTGFIAWLGIAISQYRFRRGLEYQNRDLGILPYKAPLFPFGPIFAFVLCLIITLGQNYQAFLGETIDWKGVIATYIGLPLFLGIWLSYKIVKKTKFVHYSEMSFPGDENHID